MHALVKCKIRLSKEKQQMGRNLRDLGWWELLTLGLARPDEEGGLQERKKLAAGGWALGLTVEEGSQQGAMLGREA